MWGTSTRLPFDGMSRNGPISDPFGDPKIYIEGDLLTPTLRLSSMTTPSSPTVVERLPVLCLMVASEEPRSVDKSSTVR
jgi:hypothetical protein